MILAQEFSESLEREMFLPIRRQGLNSFAQDASEDFTKQLGIDNTHIIKNAFLLHFASTLDEYNISINPKIMIKAMERSSLRITKTLHDYAADFLESCGQSDQVSNDLYAAGITAPIIKHGIPNDKYIGLIGTEAFKLIYQSSLMGDNPTLFKQDSITAEAKVLHLASHVKRMNASMTVIDNETKKMQYLSPLTNAAVLEILDHTDDLIINPDNSPLENMVQRKYNILQKTLENTPVNDRNNIFQIPS
ncbi:MAG: hypothetical protein COB14_07330 [Alphaproteobacteria bacterium]|nr:MAG: hypothetical protein COB14_07330 [Alphaproteobacteria bacterium]